MAEYIDKKKTIEIIEQNMTKVVQVGTVGAITTEVYNMAKDHAIDYLRCVPTADVQEVKHGKWKKHTDDCDCDYIECSICGEEFYPPNNEFTFDVIPKYCQNCGAKMDGGKSE